MMNQPTPNSYELSKAYRNEQEQRAEQANQTKAARQEKKGVSIAKVISQLVISIK